MLVACFDTSRQAQHIFNQHIFMQTMSQCQYDSMAYPTVFSSTSTDYSIFFFFFLPPSRIKISSVQLTNA